MQIIHVCHLTAVAGAVRCVEGVYEAVIKTSSSMVPDFAASF